jgi:hypothetical protein
MLNSAVQNLFKSVFPSRKAVGVGLGSLARSSRDPELSLTNSNSMGSGASSAGLRTLG